MLKIVFRLSLVALLYANINLLNAKSLPLLAEDNYFYVGGQYVAAPDGQGQVMTGQMYVHVQIPVQLKHKFPIIMIHGANQTGTNYEGTPDGRPGWSTHFLARGYSVYVIDQPVRGRSAVHPDLNTKFRRSNAQFTADRWTAPETNPRWPQAKFHTQWPGSGALKGQPGDPIFDQFYASQVETLSDTVQTERMMRDAGAALLDRIGPAVLITHSQGGALGWQIVDARPHLVKAVLAIEPSTTPSFDQTLNSNAANVLGPSYGITESPISYAPSIDAPSQLSRKAQSAPDSPELWTCWMQDGTPRTLPTLAGVTIAIVTAQASAFAQTNHCLSKYLTQAGVNNDFIRLEKVGILGNGHMMMLEKNSNHIADFLIKYLMSKKI